MNGLDEPIGAEPQVKVAGRLWAALDLWGMTRGRTLQFVALVITASFVVIEVKYNTDLLNTISDPSAPREVIQSLSDRGKLLTALGLAWVCGRFLLDRVRPAIIGILLLVCLGAGVYVGLDKLYTNVIEGLPTAVKLKGFGLFSYRQDLLTGNLVDPDIPLPKNEPINGRLIMGAFPIILLDERYMLPVRNMIELKADDITRFVLKDANAAWPDYQRQMRELGSGYREFIDGSKRAISYRDMGGVEEFRQKSGGLNPDPSLTPDQFLDVLRRSNTPKSQTLRDGEARQVARRPDGRPVLAGEIPKFMDRQQYLDWFKEQAREARDRAIPTLDTIEKMKNIHEINSAIFLPPMAMIASLTSAVTNGLTFIILSVAFVAQQVRSGKVQAFGRVTARYSAPAVLTIFLALLLAAPSHVFTSGPMHTLEDKMHSSVGIAGHVWSRLSHIQAWLLRSWP